MHDDVARVERRVARFVAERLRPAVYRRQHPLTVSSWDTPGEPVDFGTASAATYAPCSADQPWGRPWGTTWFRLSGEAPADWAREEGLRAEVVVDLGFGGTQPGFSAEATAYAPDGTVVKGLHPRNRHLPVRGSGPVDFYLEASANPDVGSPTPCSDRRLRAPTGSRRWATPTSTRRGCGRSGRRHASAPAPSRMCWR